MTPEKKIHPKKKKIYAPFGVSTKRFLKVGFHPNLDISGAMKKDTPLGPGQYNINYNLCWYKKYPTKESWTRKRELEEFSLNLGFRNAEVLRQRQEAKRALGPGSLEINENLFKVASKNAKDDVYFGIQKRFHQTINNVNPGPGSYGKNHEPYVRYEESHGFKKQWTYLPPFEWDGFIDRFRVNQKPWALAPNRYEPSKTGIDEILAKRVSKRGPYDLFTGPRNDSTIRGYFAQYIPARNEYPTPLIITAEMDKLKHPKKARYGCFFQSQRFNKNYGSRLLLNDLNMCPKNPKDPGPGHYDIEKSTKKVKKNMYPFNSSILYVRPAIKWELKPGVGRYDPKEAKCKEEKNKTSWVFKSVVNREINKVVKYNSF